MPHCFVPGCTSRTRGRLDSGKVKRRFYSAPVKNKELLEKWRISIGRKDLELDSKARICDLHFAEDLLQKYDEFIINGEQVSFPRTNWRLKPDAVPTIFHVAQESELCSRKRRKCGDVSNSPEITAFVKELSDSSDTEEERDPNQSELGRQSESSKLRLAICHPADSRILLPSPGWSLIKPDGLSSHVLYCCESVILDDSFPSIRKWAKVDFHSRIIESGVFKSRCPQLESFISLEAVNHVLKRIHDSSLCKGIDPVGKDLPTKDDCVSDNGAWRSQECGLLVEDSAQPHLRSSSAAKKATDENTICSSCRTWNRRNLEKKRIAPQT